ncbi:MAG: sugar transferase [Verrucomicrobiota bacterium]
MEAFHTRHATQTSNTAHPPHTMIRVIHARTAGKGFISCPHRNPAAEGGGLPHRNRARHRTPGSAAASVGISETRALLTVGTRQGPPATKGFGWKRGLDLGCIVLSLPLILPLMVLIALWIKLCSRGPALVRQRRIGRNGKPFVLYKFRSMEMHSGIDRQKAYVRSLIRADRPLIKRELVCDSPLIAGGCLLRASGLDELPQLLNVLRGEMSLVGPRPCLPGEYQFFTPRQRERFNALPGITGNWQVNGKNRSTFREMNVMDIHYVRNASLLLDLQLMLRTPGALLHQMMLACQHRQMTQRILALAKSGTAFGLGRASQTPHR